jgi:hypothetical protein
MDMLPQVLGMDMGVNKADQINQIVFTIRIIQKPSTILLSLLSLIMIQQSSTSFILATLSSPSFGNSLTMALARVRNLYKIENVENKVMDGIEPFPENQQSLRSGISVEFRLVNIYLSRRF